MTRRDENTQFSTFQQICLRVSSHRIIYLSIFLSNEKRLRNWFISKLKDDLNLTLTSFNFRGPLSIPVYACYCLNHCRFIGVLYNCTGPKIIPGACFPKAPETFRAHKPNLISLHLETERFTRLKLPVWKEPLLTSRTCPEAQLFESQLALTQD